MLTKGEGVDCSSPSASWQTYQGTHTAKSASDTIIFISVEAAGIAQFYFDNFVIGPRTTASYSTTSSHVGGTTSMMTSSTTSSMFSSHVTSSATPTPTCAFDSSGSLFTDGDFEHGTISPFALSSSVSGHPVFVNEVVPAAEAPENPYLCDYVWYTGANDVYSSPSTVYTYTMTLEPGTQYSVTWQVYTCGGSASEQWTVYLQNMRLVQRYGDEYICQWQTFSAVMTATASIANLQVNLCSDGPAGAEYYWDNFVITALSTMPLP